MAARATILDLRSEWFYLLLIYKSPDTSCQVLSQWAFLLWRRISKQINFQDGNCGRHLVFPIRMILAIFDLQVTLMLSTKFRVNWHFSSGEEAQSWISSWNNSSYFLSTSKPDASYQVSSQEKTRKIDFQNGGHGRHLGFLIRKILAIFDLQVTPNASYQVSSQLAFGFRRRSEKKIMKMAAKAAISDFWS